MAGGDAGSVLGAIGDRRVVLCVGPGGVGKTTTSAALALAAAMRGKKVLVLTIDPARRLADALGVARPAAAEAGRGESAVGNEPTRVDDRALREAGTQVAGELWAVMLDSARTFDDLVRRLSPTPEHAHRLMNNAVYRQLSRALAGGTEFTAVEKLFDLYGRQAFDLIVVDTPPSKNVIDFIEAPRFLARFLDERVLRVLLVLDPERPAGGFAARLMQRTGRLVGDVLGKVLGGEMVNHIVEFLRSLEVMAEQLKRRCDEVSALLQSEASGFFVITSPDPVVLEDAAALRQELAQRAIPFIGYVVNRIERPSGVDDPGAALDELRTAAGDDARAERVAAKLGVAIAEVDARAARHSQAVDALRQKSGWQGFVGTLPRELSEVNDLRALARLSAVLLGA